MKGIFDTDTAELAPELASFDVTTISPGKLDELEDQADVKTASIGFTDDFDQRTPENAFDVDIDEAIDFSDAILAEGLEENVPDENFTEALDEILPNEDELEAFDKIVPETFDRSLLRSGFLEETKRYTSTGENNASYVVSDEITYYEEHSIE